MGAITVDAAGATKRTFADTFDPKLNALNLIRLILAAGVIIWHSFPLSGNQIEWWPLRQAMENFFVDGFFAISGFLIVSSWQRDPHWGRCLRARTLRILPAFWTCLILTAVVIAPLAQQVWGPENVGYVLRNAGLWMFQYDIAGTPSAVPFGGAWNGSLWTLGWEFLCYLGVLALGILGLMKRSWTIPALFVLAVLGAIVTTPEIMGDNVVGNAYLVNGSRFGLMFLAGAVVYQFRASVRVSWLWASAAVCVLGVSLAFPNYRIFAALAVAYLLLTTGALIKRERLRLRNDISYGMYIYAFPMQQVLATFGAYQLGVPWFAVFSIVVTVPLAIGSWFLIEKPALRFARRGRAVPQTVVAVVP